MMTIYDEGEGVFGSMMTSSQKSIIMVNFWHFTGYFTKIGGVSDKKSMSFYVKDYCLLKDNI